MALIVLILKIWRWLAIVALLFVSAIHVSFAALYIILAAIILVAPYYLRRRLPPHNPFF